MPVYFPNDSHVIHHLPSDLRDAGAKFRCDCSREWGSESGCFRRLRSLERPAASCAAKPRH
jgi:hypothetical protein